MTEIFDVNEREERAAHNQSLFRAVNEQVKSLNEDTWLTADFGPLPTIAQWICECANASCMERIPLTLEQYEAVRTRGYRFCVAPDGAHFFPDVEQVVGREDGYWVVDKTGAAKTVAESLDPRSTPGDV
jgi:hypothetical protein